MGSSHSGNIADCRFPIVDWSDYKPIKTLEIGNWQSAIAPYFFFEDDFLPFFDDFFDPFLGTLAPSRRASDKPIAIACLRLVTFLPERPLLSVPRLRSRIARSTFFEAFLLYLGIPFPPSSQFRPIGHQVVGS
jgi:hypothetical protein